MSALRVALAQQRLAWGDAAANRAHFEQLLLPLAGGVDLVLLPETFTTGFSMEVERLAEAEGGPTAVWLGRLATRLDAAISGSVITVAAGRYYNRLLWAPPGGEMQHYDKRHLFRMGCEHEHFTPGSAARSIRWRGFNICPLVCYDLRFPVFSDFLGQPLVEGGAAAALMTVELDADALAGFRRKFPAHLDADRFTLDA